MDLSRERNRNDSTNILLSDFTIATCDSSLLLLLNNSDRSAI